MNTKRSHQIKGAENVCTQPIGTVDESNLQWKCILDICQKLPKDAKILDAGCGDGKYIIKLNFIGYKNVIGLDIIDYKDFPNFNYVKGDFNALPFESNQFDFVFAISSLYFSNDIKKAIEEIIRVAKEINYVIISGHTKYSIYSILRVIISKFSIQKYEHFKKINFIHPDLIQSIFISKGYHCVIKTGFFTSFFDKFLPQNMIGNFLNKNISDTLKYHFGYHYILVLKKEKSI